MKNLVIYINVIDDTQRALVEILDDNTYKIIMSGDWYHDKIIEKIDGFFQCLNYFNILHNLHNHKIISPEDKLYEELGFIEDCD